MYDILLDSSDLNTKACCPTIDNIFIERLWKSVKYECVYIHVFDDGVRIYDGLQEYFWFYNTERFHQSLGYKTPESVYRQTS